MLSMPRRGERTLRIWSTLLVAALGIALISCGGSGGSDRGGGGGGGGGGGSDLPTVVLPPAGFIDVAFVPGAGRATGDLWAEFRRVYFNDGLGLDPSQDVSNQKLQLNSYSTPLIVNVPVLFRGLGVDTRTFNDYWFDISKLQVETPNGFIVDIGNVQNIPYDFQGEADIRVFQGRRTGLQVFLDSSMFQINYDPNDENSVLGAAFLPDRFKEINITSSQGIDKIQGFLADYMSFDISNLPDSDKPRFLNGDVANRVFLSGDGYAIGGSPTETNKFQGLTLYTFQPIEGRFSPPGVLAGRPTPGTYSLLQNDPSQIDPNNAKLISLVGIWREYWQFVTNMSETQMISFPRSRDDNLQDVVLITQSKQSNADGTTSYSVNTILWGYIDYSVNKIRLYPIKDIVDGANVQPTVTGSLSNLTNLGGSTVTDPHDVHYATFTLSDGTSGNLVVFRK